MTKPKTDSDSKSTEGEEKVVQQQQLDDAMTDAEEKSSSSTTSASTNEDEGNKCMDPMDFISRKAKGILIGKTKKTETKKATAAAGKRRKRAQGGFKKSISLRTGLNELGRDYGSDSEEDVATNADFDAKKKLKGKAKKEEEAAEEETDAFEHSETDSEEILRRIKKGKRYFKDDDDSDGAGNGDGGLANKNLSIVAGK